MGVAVEDGGGLVGAKAPTPGAGSAGEGCDMRVSETFAADGFDDFGVWGGAEFTERRARQAVPLREEEGVGGAEAELLSEFG